MWNKNQLQQSETVAKLILLAEPSFNPPQASSAWRKSSNPEESSSEVEVEVREREREREREGMSVVVSLLLGPSHHRVHSMHKDEKGSATSHSCCFFANDKAMQQPNSLQNSPCTFKSLSLSLSLPLSLSFFSLSGEEESDEDNAVETSESAGFSCHLVVLRSWWLLHLPQHHKLSDPDNCATVCH